MESPISRYKVLAAGLFSLILTMGLARFAYTPLLPALQEQTGLSDAWAGWLAAINYLGYFAGAIAATRIADLMLKDKLYRIGLVIGVVTTAGMALTDNLIWWALMRFVAGFSAVGGLIIGSGLIMNWLVRHGHRAELGLHFGGIGLGIAFTALAAMAMPSSLGWDWQWALLGAVGLALALPAWRWMPRPDASPAATPNAALADKAPPRLMLWLLVLVYFCAGVGYVINATFIVSLVDRQPALAGQGNLIWLIVGLTAAPSALIWDRVMRRWGGPLALLLAFALQIPGILLPALSDSLIAAIASALFYGSTFVGIVAMVLTMVGRWYPSKPAKPMAQLTVSFGVAQIVGPAIAGQVAEATGVFDAALYMAAVVMAAGMILLLVMHRRESGRVAAKPCTA